MRAKEIVERIMTQHWDIAACHCWVCTEGRKTGCGARDEYIYHTNPRYKLAELLWRRND